MEVGRQVKNSNSGCSSESCSGYRRVSNGIRSSVQVNAAKVSGSTLVLRGGGIEA